MGTRHLTAAVIDGEYKIAQYGQWDGYPSGQGIDVRNFCERIKDKASASREVFAEKLRATRFITNEEIEAAYKQLGIKEIEGGFITMEDADKFKAAHPQIDRDMGADILDFVMDKPAGVLLKDSIYFAADSTFCEWAYVIDLDKDRLEVFKGFNRKPLDKDERFASVKQHESGCYPIRLAKAWPLSELPSQQEFLKAFEVKEE